MMNQFDEFIDETDKKLNIDTSEKIAPSLNDREADIAAVTGGVPASPKSPIISNTSKFNLQRQITPTRIDDHPLKGTGNITQQNPTKPDMMSSPPLVTAPTSQQVPVPRTAVPKRRSVLMNKRRSLIQPVIAAAPESPDSFNSKAGFTDDGMRKASAGAPPRKYSIGNSIIDPEHMQLSSVHSRSSSQASTSTNTETHDINTLLKSLASKEMDLFESKRKIEDLKKQLALQEKLYNEHASELQKLKSQVTKHLSENANNTSSNISSPVMTGPPTFVSPRSDSKLEVPKERVVPSITNRSPEARDGKLLRKRGTKVPPSRSRTTSPVNSMREVPITHTETVDSRRVAPQEDSVWNKSFAMFNQFDQILQNELEKSLNWDSETDNESPEKVSRDQGVNIFNPGTPESDKVRARQNMNPPLAKPNPGISKSLWSFVDSVRSGLLGIDENEEYDVESQSGSHGSQNAPGGTLSQPTAMKQFKTAQKSQTNKLQFIDDISDKEESTVPKNVEMADF